LAIPSDFKIRPATENDVAVILALIKDLAKERNCGRFEWSVLDWNEPAIRTYDRLNEAGCHILNSE